MRVSTALAIECGFSGRSKHHEDRGSRAALTGSSMQPAKLHPCPPGAQVQTPRKMMRTRRCLPYGRRQAFRTRELALCRSRRTLRQFRHDVASFLCAAGSPPPTRVSRMSRPSRSLSNAVAGQRAIGVCRAISATRRAGQHAVQGLSNAVGPSHMHYQARSKLLGLRTLPMARTIVALVVVSRDTTRPHT